MREYKRHRFKRPGKYPGLRSIPLRNPREVRWPADVGRPRPHSGPTDECFEADARWYTIKEGQMVRVTGEPDDKPKYLVIERRDKDVELRLYYLGTEYIFVQLYYCIGKVFRSVLYRGRKAAIRAYSTGDIKWRMSQPLRGAD